MILSSKASMQVALRQALEVKRARMDGPGIHGCLLDPRKSKRLSYWDATTASCLVFVALITPYEVGFLEGIESITDPLFLLNRVIDIIFICDFALQFNLVTEMMVNGEKRWVSDRRRIAQHYLRTWFTIDVMAIGVSGFDWVTIIQMAGDGGSSDPGSSGASGNATSTVMWPTARTSSPPSFPTRMSEELRVIMEKHKQKIDTANFRGP